MSFYIGCNMRYDLSIQTVGRLLIPREMVRNSGEADRPAAALTVESVAYVSAAENNDRLGRVV